MSMIIYRYPPDSAEGVGGMWTRQFPAWSGSRSHENLVWPEHAGHLVYRFRKVFVLPAACLPLPHPSTTHHTCHLSTRLTYGGSGIYYDCVGEKESANVLSQLMKRSVIESHDASFTSINVKLKTIIMFRNA